MLERVWAGWRNDYVSNIDRPAQVAASDQGTLFQRILAADGDDAEAGIVHRGDLASVILNAYPYGSGHVLVVPNRAVERLAELTPEEARALWDTVQHTAAVIEAVYEPGGINVGLNQGRAAGAGIPDHLHVHVLPRWSGDTNFMTSIAETRVLPEPPDETIRRIRDGWDSASGSSM